MRLDSRPCAGARNRHDLRVKLFLEVRDQIFARLDILELIQHGVVAAPRTLTLPVREKADQCVMRDRSQPPPETA
jgi:hypothetical protein